MEVLKTEGLRKYYGTGENLVKALDGVDISVERGEFLAVVGTSGSGKSTLLHMLEAWTVRQPEGSAWMARTFQR